MSDKWLQVIDQAIQKIEENEVELGLAALRKIQEHGRNLPDVMLYLADVWYQLGHLQEAAQLVEQIKQTTGLPEELRQEGDRLLAEICLDEGDYETAQTLLYQLQEEGDDSLQLYLLLADLYALQDLPEVAVKYLEKARAMEPDNQQLLSALSDMYFHLGRTTEALSLLKDSDPSQLPLSNLLAKARTLAQNGQFEEAYAIYQTALLHQRSAEILFGAGLMAFHLGKLKEAETYVEQLLVLDEEYTSAYPLLADIFLSQGNSDKAIDALKQYVSLSGFELEQIKRLTALLEQAGRYDEAREYETLYRQWDSTEEDE